MEYNNIDNNLMSINSFNIDINYLNELEPPVLYLCQRDKKVIMPIVYNDLSMTFNLNAFNTISFTVYEYLNNERQEVYDALIDELLIFIPKIGYYIMFIESNETDGATWSKKIKGTSLEKLLCTRYLTDFQINSNNILYDDYDEKRPTKFYYPDPSYKDSSLLHLILKGLRSWTIGHVDESLYNLQRSFDESEVDIYSFLTNTVSKAFDCLFIFDTIGMTVNAYDLKSYGINSGIYISEENFVNNLSIGIQENSIFTCLKITGGDKTYINEINPNGTDKIYNFSYFYKEMENDLVYKLKLYNKRTEELKQPYEEAIVNMEKCLDEILNLQNNTPEKEPHISDLSECGLNYLNTQKDAYFNNIALLESMGANNTSSPNYSEYKNYKDKLEKYKQEIILRESQIKDKRSEYGKWYDEKTKIQNELKMDNFFTEEEIKKLDMYVIEANYSNENYSVTEYMTDAERIDMTKQLYDKGVEELNKQCMPIPQYSASLNNFLVIPEMKEFIPYFNLGNIINLKTDKEVVQERLISYTINFKDTNKISNVTFSNATKVKNYYSDKAQIQAQVSSAVSSFNFNKDRYDKSSKSTDFIEEIRNYGLDLAQIRITNSKNQNFLQDESGTLFRKEDKKRAEGFEPEMIKIINNCIVFSDDYFNKGSIKQALGKLEFPDGSTAFGLNAEVLISNIVLSKRLSIMNENISLTVDENGFVASKNKIDVYITPENEKDVFGIRVDNKKLMYIDTDKRKLVFSGTLEGVDGTFSGKIYGGEIYIGENFSVDNNGNMKAVNGNFTGIINATGGTITGDLTVNAKLKGADIIGGTININNGAFRVKKDGMIICSKGHFSGWAITDNCIISIKDYNEGTTNEGVTRRNGLQAYDTNDGTSFAIGYHYGSKDWKDAFFYINHNGDVVGQSANFRTGLKSKGKNVSVVGHSHSSSEITATTSSSSNGTFVKLGGYSLPTASYVINNFQPKEDSDIRLKKDIHSVDEELMFKIYQELKPKYYRFKSNYIDDKIYWGLIAQELIALFDKYNINYEEQGIIEIAENIGDNDLYCFDGVHYRVNYNNFHAWHISCEQKLCKIVKEHEIRIKRLERKEKNRWKKRM